MGGEEIARLRSQMTEVSRPIDSDRSVDDVIELLETDPSRRCPRRSSPSSCSVGSTTPSVPSTASPTPDPVKRVTVNLAPPGGALGAWYINPSEDWQRSGSVWYALGERDRIPTWQEVTTAYHEGFPGHHLQIGVSMWQKDRLSKAQRLLVWYSGYGEGWALYAERLMDELGFFEKPEYRLGMLASQLFRATRVVDIGLHLGYCPEGAPLHAGETWNYDIAVDYMDRIGLQPRDLAESEVKRYLGWPGQAISYKLGEREILDIRSRLQADPSFDLKEFHRQVLEGGEVRLDYLRERLLGNR